MKDGFSFGFNSTFSITIHTREPSLVSAILARRNISSGKTEGHVSRPIRHDVVGDIERAKERFKLSKKREI